MSGRSLINLRRTRSDGPILMPKVSFILNCDWRKGLDVWAFLDPPIDNNNKQKSLVEVHG